MQMAESGLLAQIDDLPIVSEKARIRHIRRCRPACVHETIDDF